MTIRDRVRQWLGLDRTHRLIDNWACVTLAMRGDVASSASLVKSSGEWAAQNGLAIQAQLNDMNAKLDKLTAIIEPQAPKFIRAVPRVLSFEAVQADELARSIEMENKPNGVHS